MDSQESSPTPQSKASVLLRLAFFMVQLSHPYMTTGKTITLTRWTFVSKVISVLFNMLSRFVIAFIPRSKHLLVYMIYKFCVYLVKCLTLCDPLNSSLPDSSVRGIIQAWILEWIVITFSRESSWLTDLARLLHWQVGSLSLSHLGIPYTFQRLSNYGGWGGEESGEQG